MAGGGTKAKFVGMVFPEVCIIVIYTVYIYIYIINVITTARVADIKLVILNETEI